ncbi:glycosyltransferase family 2 protein [Dubosiella muris]|uniref:Glycosyltransferase n=1 Tax=Dubosiella muris TaxID=3038133 RepID=A0AC61R971_9FIRM|nr:glycosyltransferase family 2 protein [Dubosiella muris]TGY66881.1 glycosyltransferase [Dubosiella muris]
MDKPVLYIVIPCYNEQEVLPVTKPMFLNKLNHLIARRKVSEQSRILFVNDGSRDSTWNLIQEFANQEEKIEGISLSRNRGHQNALLAGLMEAKDLCDITISIDCDGQDDLNAMDEMVEAYHKGADIVYGVRSKRDTDTFFKRTTAEGFYKLMNKLGGEVVYNHADYRLVSAKVLEEFSNFNEVNLFLRGMFPLVGFNSTSVYYERHERLKGESHYPLKKMLALAFDGITSLSIKPIRIVTGIGIAFSIISFLLIVYALISLIHGTVVSGWTSSIIVTCLLGGIQLISLGVIGEYVGKTYLETKHRPRYIISNRTYKE